MQIEIKANNILKLINHLDFDLQLKIIENVKQRLINNTEVSNFETIKE